MLKIGDMGIKGLCLGNIKIKKTYLGTNLVFNASKPTFLDYVVFDGNSWIDTGKYANQNIEINITFKHNTLERAIYGVRDGNNNCTGYASAAGAWRFGSNSATYRTEANTIYNVVQNRQGIDINGQYTAYTDTTSEFTSSYTILLGKQNNTTFNPFKGEIYDFQIKENGILIQDLRPCIAPNGQVAMYDEVTKKYFYNKGTGELKAGGRFVKSIIFDGNSYIDMGANPTPVSKWEVDCKSSKAVGETFQSIIGVQQTTATSYRLSCIIIGANTATRFVLSGQTASIMDKDINFASVADVNKRHIYGVDVKSYTVYVDDQKLVGTTVNNISIPLPVYIMARNSVGVATNFAKGEVYTIKHWEDDVLVQDLRPCIDPKGVVCFYDMVTRQYFYNQGTGEFAYSE